MYNKLFTKILDSSIWLEPDTTRIVWLTCIASMDEAGVVYFASVANLAHRANVPLGRAETAVKALESPDPNSSDPEYGGRRLERIPGGWIVLNADKYRGLVTRAIAREQTRERVRKFRARRKSSNADVTETKRGGNGRVTPSEARSEAKSDTVRTRAAKPAAPAKPHPIKDVLALHDELYQQAVGETPDRNGGKDAKLVKALIDRYGFEKVVVRLRAFFTSPDAWIRQSGYTIGAFKSQWNKLATAEKTLRASSDMRGIQSWLDKRLQQTASGSSDSPA